jgi:hypothetical protein
MNKLLIPLILLITLSCSKGLDGTWMEVYDDNSHCIRIIKNKKMILEYYYGRTLIYNGYKTILKLGVDNILIKNDSALEYDTISKTMKMTYKDTSTYELIYKRTSFGFQWISHEKTDWIKSNKLR